MFTFLEHLRMPTIHARTAAPFKGAADLPEGFLADWAALQADIRVNSSVHPPATEP
jgi:hypothetical protein